MTPRQAHALAHPLSSASDDQATLEPLTATRRHSTGLLLMTVLAVDR